MSEVLHYWPPMEITPGKLAICDAPDGLLTSRPERVTCPDCRELLSLPMPGTGCHCDVLGPGTPEHEASALCRSLRPDAERS